MKIASFNINGVKARLPALLDWLRDADADVVVLQEIKATDDQFPRLEIEDMGYNVETHGQKGFNGVAILSKPAARGRPPRPARRRRRRAGPLDRGPGRAGRSASAASTCRTATRRPGRSTTTSSPGWTASTPARRPWSRTRRPPSSSATTTSSPSRRTAGTPRSGRRTRCSCPRPAPAFRRLVNLGLTDALRAVDQGPGIYTFWDYQAGAFQKNWGIRIDHVLLTPQAADRLETCGIDAETRGREKPSDHVPIWVTLD